MIPHLLRPVCFSMGSRPSFNVAWKHPPVPSRRLLSHSHVHTPLTFSPPLFHVLSHSFLALHPVPIPAPPPPYDTPRLHVNTPPRRRASPHPPVPPLPSPATYLSPYLPTYPPLSATTLRKKTLGWHSWRSRAARVTSVVVPAITGTTATSAPPAKPALAEARALLHAATPLTAAAGIGRDRSGGGSGGVAVLEGVALAKAATSPELAALRAAVAAKDSALALAWRGRVGSGGGGGSGSGWGAPFATPPPTKWRESVALNGGVDGGVGAAQVVAAWKAWRGSVTALVSGMEGVLDGLVGAAPSVRSSLEGHLEIRFGAIS